MNTENYVNQIVKHAKIASRSIASANTAVKNTALQYIAEGILSSTSAIKAENEKDVLAAQKAGLSEAMIDRLRLTDSRIGGMAEGVRQIIHLADPVGELLWGHTRPNGLQIQKVRVPIGVIAIIYESRPNVTADAASLCLKAGNTVILRGGKESIHSNIAIYKILTSALERAGLDTRGIQLIELIDREAIDYLLNADQYIDVVIPRGGEALIRTVVEKSTIPVIKHYKGVCHTYVDEYADLTMAEEICFNAKVQRPATCNAMETMLVHEKIAQRFLPVVTNKLRSSGVEIRGCDKTGKIAGNMKHAVEDDYYQEYLDLILNIKVVKTLDEAISHIATYGSNHSDAIVTDNVNSAMKFTREVDSAAVYVNASTRFTDGYEFGMGAEIGISTDKLHARGPMGLEELTTYKFVVFGNGQLRK
ncbi:MAG: glutamate-5-semialdehyde dehydrogenase [Planctomycetia bacterium]|uniref:Gamma-glutamyl phosphate reductase n=1 Tax=Candidatus Brocadia sapporoensis TaxID=392547 RepID=A0A1V6M2G2_9BACT|nr:glutamate-5-semialdehyde dehydrogenase [Candidatus Brocadia sapporoensis]MCC7239797.1 glutamate-5-semialdehyde dehydrogenase [Candidatus Brocadia sp.]QOJ06039.1 MAG: glutamate-5-semialdehyde dehydrogenase [Planctomycetia bacterium]TVL94970.1 MAG: glutamate-5-semialdehyde dehydrogenase [Candidatus Brocadia sp. BL1]MDG6004851.1 glutamate-5-semialdehyde dehydrogenase [Candidatus Brocadia sp.]OQD46506.1 glutamate-5-semialdehyde dehydrogenase [Candidatus Brocadia sapporoensis]